MRSILITIIASFLIMTTMRGQNQWEIVNEGIGSYIWEIDFINADTGWIYGINSLLKTMDGGNSWISLQWDGNYAWQIDFINSSVGWTFEQQSDYIFIEKTVDGGQSWFQQKKFKCDDLWRNYIYTVTDSIVYVLADGLLLKTTDGGTSWVDITPPGTMYNEIVEGGFQNADTGIVTGTFGPDNEIIILRTFDGGATWDTRTASELTQIGDIKYLNDSIAYFMAWDTLFNLHLYKTTDSFNSWSVINSDKINTDTFYGYQPFDNDVIIAVTEDSTGINIMKSYDGGLNWEYTNAMNFHGNPRPGISFSFSNNTGYVSFGGIILMKSIDQGNNWKIIQFSYPFKDVCFIDEKKGIMVGGEYGFHLNWGNIIRTDDGGETFNFIERPNNGNLESCLFISDSIGFAGFEKTTDGGNNWAVSEGFMVGQDSIEIHLYDLFYIDDRIGWGCGLVWLIDYSTKGIFKTIDGGDYWELVYMNDDVIDSFVIEPDVFNSLYFTDEESGWAVGEKGLIIKYSLNGGWQTLPAVTDLPLNKVFFVDRDNGWICGGFRNNDAGVIKPLLLRTQDSGSSWTEITDIDYLINDFYFESKDHGWAVGEDIEYRGVLLETFNAGFDWVVVKDSLSGSLNALYFKDGYGWAVGYNGLVLKTEYTPATGIGQDDPAIEREKNLLSNYPNPFHSSTTISYQLQESSEVQLSIYDLSGRKMANLVSENQQSGSHEFKWNAEGMQPGVYFCTLKTRQGRQVIKMILIE